MAKYNLSHIDLPDFEAKNDQEALLVGQAVARLLSSLSPNEMDKASRKIHKMSRSVIGKAKIQAFIHS
jgi:hypothetical protein